MKKQVKLIYFPHVIQRKLEEIGLLTKNSELDMKSK